MAFIDHRILIPAPQSVVWDYIGKLVNCTKWQVDCSKIAFLTTRQEGVGARYRLTTPQGREYVAEIRAWYEGLGYEYSYVERPPFKSALGRVRLQEIPEGTVVQWTLEYEIGGVLGGVRGALGVARQLDNDIAQSLKKLYLQIKTDRARIIEPIGAPKALMRDAPDAEARAVYRPRHPSAVQQDDEASPAKALPAVRHAPALEEPPAAHDDTRPNRSLEGEQVAASAPILPEPSFLAEVPEFERALDEDTLLGDPLSHAQQIDVRAISRELSDQKLNAEPVEAAQEAQLTEQLTSAAEPVGADDKRSTRESAAVTLEPEPTTPALPPVIEEPPLGSDSERLLDTSKVSIWEVFGLPRPSDSEELKAVTVSPPVSDVPISPPTVLPALPSEADHEVETSVAPSDSLPAEPWQPPRIGLRLKLRRKHLRVRRFF